jgi:putative transcriptional regulator
MTDVLKNKSEITRLQILVEIAENQPAVSQKEIADAIGVTPQAVSDHMSSLVDEGLVDKRRRGRYEITKEGADLVLSYAESLEGYVEHVLEEVVGRVFVDTAVADGDIGEGQEVSLCMRDGFLRAVPGSDEPPTARAVTDASEGDDVGVTEFDGIIEFDSGNVTVVTVPSVEEGGSRAVDTDALGETVERGKPVYAVGTEAAVALEKAGIEYRRYAVAEAVVEAARNGVSSTVVAVEGRAGSLTDELSAEGVKYETVEAQV